MNLMTNFGFSLSFSSYLCLCLVCMSPSLQLELEVKQTYRSFPSSFSFSHFFLFISFFSLASDNKCLNGFALSETKHWDFFLLFSNRLITVVAYLKLFFFFSLSFLSPVFSPFILIIHTEFCTIALLLDLYFSLFLSSPHFIKCQF